MATKVILGMSGGVDSSVAAYLLLQQGYEVEGMFMKNWEQDDTNEYCHAALDLADAQSVCHQLGIKLHTVNFAQTYWDSVFEYFLHEYQNGRTPNPDVLCNKEIKFKAFLEHALLLGADYIATGHYAKLKHLNGIGELYKAKDRNKDQTYFLNQVTPQALGKTLFPLGDLSKEEVRKIAEDLGLINYNKKDSTGICFIGERRFKTFLQEYILAKPGPIITTEGKCIGQHDGLMYYTLGQRQGLGIGGLADSSSAPWYVVDKDIHHNNLIVGQGAHHPSLYAQGLICGPIHWLTTEIDQNNPLSCFAKTRYRQEDRPCLVSPLQGNEHCIMFSSPERAVTPGQFIVFYDKNKCLGGAVIESLIK